MVQPQNASNVTAKNISASDTSRLDATTLAIAVMIKLPRAIAMKELPLNSGVHPYFYFQEHGRRNFDGADREGTLIAS